MHTHLLNRPRIAMTENVPERFFVNNTFRYVFFSKTLRVYLNRHHISVVQVQKVPPVKNALARGSLVITPLLVVLHWGDI